jgi:predicted MFS family arabinose efflux permease
VAGMRLRRLGQMLGTYCAGIVSGVAVAKEVFWLAGVGMVAYALLYEWRYRSEQERNA